MQLRRWHTDSGAEVWADTAYRAAETEATLKAKGYKSRIHRRAVRNRSALARQPCQSAAAWHQKKSWALVATRDHNINPDLERRMAKRAGSETIEVPASHAVYLSKPDEVARLIERAAKASAQ